LAIIDCLEDVDGGKKSSFASGYMVKVSMTRGGGKL